MLDGLRHYLRDLTGRGDGVFVEALGGQLDATTQAAQFALEQVGGPPESWDPKTMVAATERIEEIGDRWRGELVARLSRALTTPMDREDLFRLSRSIDDVLDNLRDFTRELALYRPSTGESFLPVLRTLVDGLPALRGAVDDLMEGPSQALSSSHQAKQVANALRERYEEQIARLFDLEFEIDVLKRRELLRRLDVVGLRFSEAADALADGALKRSH